jgi:hypothetical protein
MTFSFAMFDNPGEWRAGLRRWLDRLKERPACDDQ